MSKKILYLDMDGVVADFDKRLRELFPDVGNMPASQERSDAIDNVCQSHPNLFEELEPIEGAVDAVNELNKYFEIYFLSTPIWSVPESCTGKRLWLVKIFGEELPKKRLILTHRKDLNIGDFLVDDRLKNGAAEFKGEHVHFATEKFPNWRVTLPYLISKK